MILIVEAHPSVTEGEENQKGGETFGTQCMCTYTVDSCPNLSHLHILANTFTTGPKA